MKEEMKERKAFFASESNVHTLTSTGSTTSLTTQRMSKRERIGSVRSTYMYMHRQTFSISIIMHKVKTDYKEHTY